MRDIVQNNEAAKQQMLAWYSRRPTFALMGEFSAGKSTLLNVLLGQPILPAMVTATKLPVIWMTYDAQQSCYGLTQDGQLHEIDSITPNLEVWDKYQIVRMALDAPVLKLSDIIDTPGISDPRLGAGSLNSIAQYVDFAIWCTAANQAWRQSEKAAWSSLPDNLREDSLLAVTRADTLGTAKDIHKVIKRMRMETRGLFRNICPIASLHAAEAAQNGKVIDPVGWQESGADALMQEIKASIANAQKSCESRQKLPDPVQPQETETPQKAIADVIDQKFETALSESRKIISEIGQERSKNKVLATIEHVRDLLLRDQQLDDAHVDVLARCLRVDNSDELDFSRVLEQVEQDIEDFAKGAWCHLAEGRRARNRKRNYRNRNHKSNK